MKNFFDFKDTKITEKAFSQNILISIAGILLSIVMLCSSTYAWFSADISSNTNKLESGHFRINVVSVAPVVDGTPLNENAITANASGVYTLVEGTYMITVEPTAESNVKGYCLVTANGEEYRTDVIVNDRAVNEQYPTPNTPYVFYIKVSESTKVKIDSRWGIPADADVSADGTLDLSVSNI